MTAYPQHATTCPYCGRLNELHAGADAASRPTAGDVSICWLCRKAGVFTAGPLGLAVRKPTPDEQAAMAKNPQVKRALAAVSESYGPLQALGLLRGDAGA